MKNQKTMFALLFVLMLGLLTSACAPAIARAAQEVQETPAAQLRTLNVVGTAQEALDPDIAYITIGVHTENKDAKAAVDSNNVQAQKVIDALKGVGVAVKDMRTNNFSIYPQDEWGPDGAKIGSKFVVDNTVYVTLRDLDKVGDILTVAVEAGANSIYGVTFDVADKTKALEAARAKAIENAREQAEELAKAAGVELGDIQSISYYNSGSVPLYDAKVAMGMGSGGVPISTGQLMISADVSVTFVIR